MYTLNKNVDKAPARFELTISCLLDRRFNQLSHGAKACLPLQVVRTHSLHSPKHGNKKYADAVQAKM